MNEALKVLGGLTVSLGIIAIAVVVVLMPYLAGA